VGNSLGGRIGLDMAAQRPDRLHRMVLMGAPGVGMTLTDELKALREYEPSKENMRQLLLSYFAADPAIITDDLVRTRYEASVAPGAFEAYRDMFFSPRHAGGELGITEEQVIKNVMLKDTVDGQFTTTRDVTEASLFFAAFESNALTGQSLIVSHGWVME